jgi:hypothetical protein
MIHRQFADGSSGASFFVENHPFDVVTSLEYLSMWQSRSSAE